MRGDSPRRRARVRRLQPAVALVLIALGLLAPAVVVAIDGEITSAGPLTRIIITPDLNCQVAHRDDVSLEFFGGETGACGTFLSVGGTLFGPAAIPAGSVGATAWTPISQSPTSGSGSGGDPFRITTTVDAGAVGVRIEQTDSYQLGQESYRTDVRITNSGGAEQRAILYRAGDCYLQDSDAGFGRVDRGAPACVISLERDARIEQWLPLTSGSRYFEGPYAEVWTRVRSQESFPDQCSCDIAVDNGAGLSWELVLPAGGTVEVSHLTFFSPLGLQPGTSFRDSVPGPSDINLDPVVIASSAAIAAGVVLFVPFPAALFNSTLEENYAEVMSAVGRLRRWFGRLFAGLFTRGKRAVAGPEPAPASGPAPAGFQLDEAFWKSPLGILVFLLISALLYGLLDPTFGIDSGSLATFLGLALGMGAMLLAFGIPMLIGGRGHGLSARALPGTLLVAAACVLISRLASFQPGYLYGLIIGFTFARPLAKPDAGKLDAVAAASGLGLAIVSWVLLPVVRGAADSGDQQFTAAILETAFATVVVAGLEAAAIAMLPMRFLPGERVRGWNKRAWAALLGVAAFGFCHLLLNPSSGYLADASQTSLFTVVWLLVAFGGGSVLFWAYFRFRPSREPEASAPSP